MADARTSGTIAAPVARSRWLLFGLGMSAFFAVMSLAAFAAVILNIALFSVPSASNEPTLQVGDNFLSVCYDTDCHFHVLPIFPRVNILKPALGDVAVFRKPDDPSIVYVKRIVGMPGDSVQMRDGLLVINGKPVPERALPDYALAPHGEAPRNVRQFEETLPNGVRYRVIRLFPENELANTQVFQVPPGHYFMIGDNRDNSSDSRDPSGGIGFVPRDDMLARAYWITFSTAKSDRVLTAVDLPPGPQQGP